MIRHSFNTGNRVAKKKTFMSSNVAEPGTSSLKQYLIARNRTHQGFSLGFQNTHKKNTSNFFSPAAGKNTPKNFRLRRAKTPLNFPTNINYNNMFLHNFNTLLYF